jgi:hypothetical protein
MVSLKSESMSVQSYNVWSKGFENPSALLASEQVIHEVTFSPTKGGECNRN